MRKNAARCTWLLALLLTAGPTAQALGTDVGMDHFPTHPAVSGVQLCGQWGADRQGQFRVLHAEQYAQSFLYIQWMERGGPDAGYALQVVHTASIAELNNDHAEISLTELACRATPRGIAVTARASSGHGERLRRVEIEAGHAPGVYRYRAQFRR